MKDVTFPTSPTLRVLLDAIVAGGGRPAVIGGAVRDWIMGFPPKDVDVEVYGLAPNAVELALAAFRVDVVGRSFGVLKVTIDGDTFDVSLPRRESKEGRGHRGFLVTADPGMTPEEAAGRRDFTVNTVGWDYLSGSLIDHHGGVVDIERRVLRHTSPAFVEDPLRVLRGCQFAARFGFSMAPETVVLCRTLVDELATIPTERLWAEWTKLLLKSPRPSVGLNALVETGAIALFPELRALIHVPQDPEWHPEGQDHPLGSLWIHNGMVTDMAVRVLDEDGVTDLEERMIVILGALCHDFGKPSTTRFEDGRWRSKEHEEKGEAPCRSFLGRIGCPPRIVDAVVPLVLNHLKPFQLGRASNITTGAVRRLALKGPLHRLCRVARADYWGRTTSDAVAITDSRRIGETAWLLQVAEELRVADAAPKPILMGRHLLSMGFRPGPGVGRALARAFEAQLEGAFADENSAIAWARENLPPSSAR